MLLLFLVDFQFLVSMLFLFLVYMLVFSYVFQGVEAESIEGFIKTKLQPNSMMRN